MELDCAARGAWVAFLNNAENLGHAERKLVGRDINAHVDACRSTAIRTAERVRGDLAGDEPRFILEVGSSTGLNCFALQEVWPKARVIGIEPEVLAVRAAQAMTQLVSGPAPEFAVAYGEALPVPDGVIDLLICHTVVEHVQDVESVIGEMARVLSRHGRIHLEAPNYVWPYEPHLGIWCLPLMGKASVKLAARLQGKDQHREFLDHLQFITPGRLEAHFQKYGMAWENRAKKKLLRALAGDVSEIMAYRRVVSALRLVAWAGLGGVLVELVVWLKLYPSLLYTLRKAVPIRGVVKVSQRAKS